MTMPNFLGLIFLLVRNREKKITSELKLLKNNKIIDKFSYKIIKPVGFRQTYGLDEIHMETHNGLLPFHPILSVIGTTTYKLAAMSLLQSLTPSVANECTAIDSFHLA